MEQPETKLEYIIENERLREINAALLKALEAASELWNYLPFDSGDDIQKVAQRVAKLQRAAIKAAKGE